MNEAFEWIAKENGEENLRDFMDSIDITDDDLNAETDLSMNADYTKGYTDVTEKVQHKDKYGRPKETVVQSLTGYAGNCPSCDKRINFPVGGGGLYCNDCQVYLLPSREKGLNKTLRYDAENEVFNANAKSGDKVYVITRRCEDYSAYRELDVAIFGSKTEAKKKFNILFKEAKEEEYPDETIADAKSYMRWGDVGWGIESFMAGDMIYELNEHTVGNKGDFYFDAEEVSKEIKKELIMTPRYEGFPKWKKEEIDNCKHKIIINGYGMFSEEPNYECEKCNCPFVIEGDSYFDAESQSDIDLESYEKPYNDKDFYDGDYFCDICGSNRNADNDEDLTYEEKKPASYLKRGVINACSGCLRNTKGSKDIQPLIDKIKGDSQ